MFRDDVERILDACGLLYDQLKSPESAVDCALLNKAVMS